MPDRARRLHFGATRFYREVIRRPDPVSQVQTENLSLYGPPGLSCRHSGGLGRAKNVFIRPGPRAVVHGTESNTSAIDRLRLMALVASSTEIRYRSQSKILGRENPGRSYSSSINASLIRQGAGRVVTWSRSAGPQAMQSCHLEAELVGRFVPR
jgi:hypothetical protein